MYCSHHDRGKKRLALLEVMTAEEMNDWLEGDNAKLLSTKPPAREFNHLLEKVYLNGYITEKTYRRYFIPNA
ncbi:MAG: hypothetical protein U5K84_05535 [Alkalibacterium sp.]|nr:hypothetical protein [Alkalibacterium sp.]